MFRPAGGGAKPDDGPPPGRGSSSFTGRFWARRRARGADLLFFDGTFWSDTELAGAGVDAPAARDMGHLPIGGSDGSLQLLPRRFHARSEERRVGKEWRSRWSPYH